MGLDDVLQRRAVARLVCSVAHLIAFVGFWAPISLPKSPTHIYIYICTYICVYIYILCSQGSLNSLGKLVVVPILACIISILPELLCCAFAGSGVDPHKLGLDMELLADSTAAKEQEGSTTAWQQKVEELAGRGITLRQLLDFYAHLGEDVMKHYDPPQSTTHDVAWLSSGWLLGLQLVWIL